MTNRELSQARMTLVFGEWDKRYRESPDAFLASWPADGTYGERAAAYFAELADELDAADLLPRPA